MAESNDTEAYAERIQRRKAIQDRRMAETVTDRGLVIVHTGAGKGKTTAALGMVLRSLGHGYRVAIVQFIKGAWEPAEKRAFEPSGSSLRPRSAGYYFDAFSSCEPEPTSLENAIPVITRSYTRILSLMRRGMRLVANPPVYRPASPRQRMMNAKRTRYRCHRG